MIIIVSWPSVYSQAALTIKVADASQAPSLVLPASHYTLDLSIHRCIDSPVDGLFPRA